MNGEHPDHMMSVANLSMLLTASAAAGAAVPLAPTPSPKWVLNYAANSCILSRARLGRAGGLMIETRPYEAEHELTFLLPKEGKPRFTKLGSLSVVDSRPSLPHYISVEEPRGGTDRLVGSSISNGQLALAIQQRALGVTIAGRLNERVSTIGLGKALSALKACEEDLAAKWGTPKNWSIDPVPNVDPRSVFRDEDYPAAMLNANVQGDVRLLVKIGPLGDAIACRSIDREERKALAEVVCAIIRTRVKFTPAKNASGLSVDSLYVTPRIRFRVEN